MKPFTITLLVIVIVVIGIGFNYYWPGPASPAYRETVATTPTGDDTDATQNPTLGTNATSTLGTYLVAFNGMTLYTFINDSYGTPTCYGECLDTWPPYTVPAGTKLTGKLPIQGSLAFIVRADGAEHVTYNGIPLYFYIKDKAPGDTSGHTVDGAWFVAKP